MTGASFLASGQQGPAGLLDSPSALQQLSERTRPVRLSLKWGCRRCALWVHKFVAQYLSTLLYSPTNADAESDIGCGQHGGKGRKQMEHGKRSAQSDSRRTQGECQQRRDPRPHGRSGRAGGRCSEVLSGHQLVSNPWSGSLAAVASNNPIQAFAEFGRHAQKDLKSRSNFFPALLLRADLD